MIFSFSGAQSTGKTTLLNHLQKLNPDINFVSEVTRLVRREYNVPINEEGTDITQTLIMSKHLENIFNTENRNKNCILDRCSLDGIVYTHWLCNEASVNMHVYNFARYVFKETMSHYETIFYTSPDDVKIEDDGERSINSDFRDEIIKLFNQYMALYSGKIVILKGTVEERLIQIKETLAKKNIDIKI
jgi:predicted ATPase